jgi:carbon monoxide dehydrogenase subunit G
MDINGTHRFAASPQRVWDALHNSSTMQSCIPGAQQASWQGDSLVINGGISMGPVNRSGTITIQASEQQSPSHMKLSISRASVSATATVDLAPDGSGTLATYNAHADLSGALAAAGMVAKPIVEGQLKQFFSCLDSKVG